LGAAYDSLRQYQKSIECHHQSLEICREIGDRGGEAISLGNLGNAYDSLGQYQRAIEFHQQSLDIKREIGDRGGEALALQNLAVSLNKAGRAREGFAAGMQAQEIRQELDLPFDAYPYPKWMKSLIKFAKRSKWHLALCFVAGVVAFPFALVWGVVLIGFRWLRSIKN